MSRGMRVGEQYFHESAPGVYREDVYGLPQRSLFMTSVPAFLGTRPLRRPIPPDPKTTQPDNKAGRSKPDRNQPIRFSVLSWWSQFEHYFQSPFDDAYLAYAVRGFFQNGGRRCCVVNLKDLSAESLQDGLDSIAGLNTVDLVCVPELATLGSKAFDLQQIVVKHCENAGDRFAILDSRHGDTSDGVADQWSAIDGHNGAIYYPWLRVSAFEHGKTILIPPCGHVAGIYARTDAARGVHKAPANEVLDGVLDLERQMTNAEQGILNPKSVNCIRSFPGRGMRVWGARTLSGQPDWTYVNVRRLFLTAVRWMNWNMTDMTFEPNNAQLWARIERELNTYFVEQYRSGALKGRTPGEAFYVKCDAETNPPEVQDANRVVTEIGLAPTTPFEFIVVRFIHGATGVSIEGPVVVETIS